MNRSTLRRAAALVAVPATIVLFAAPAAWAQDDAALTVNASKDTCGRTTLTATAPTGVYEIAVYSGPNAGGAASDPIGQFSTSPDGPVSHTFTLDEDAYDGSGFVSWATISGPEQNNYVHGAIGVKTDCAPPVDEEPKPTPDPEPEPTVDPEPTEDPDPTVTDEPDPTSTQPAPDSTEPPAPTTDTNSSTTEDDTDGVYYENCAAARDAGAAPLYVTDDGYRAELDSDGDAVACENDTLYNGSGDYSQVGEVPVGSAETGAA